MKNLTLVLSALVVVACGGSQERGVMTQEERLNEQLALADEQTRQEAEYNERFSAAETDDEEAAKFDRANAEYELKRATLSAVDCPNTLPAESLKGYKAGTANLSIVFGNQGDVTDVTIDSAYAETHVGNCVLQAIRPVRIKTFTGAPETVEWQIELPEPKKQETPKKK